MGARAEKLEELGERRPPRRRHRDPEHSAIISAPAGDDGHTHCVLFKGETGRGFTSPGPDGHVHRVQELSILEAGGHTHELSANRCGERHHFETGRHVQARR